MLSAILLGYCGSVAQAESDLLQRVRADYAALSQAMTEFDRARTAGELGAAEEVDFIGWVEQLVQQVHQGCRALELESDEPVPVDLPCDKFIVGSPEPIGIDISAERSREENTAAMLDQLHSALSKFDEQLLQEQEKIKAQTPRDDSAHEVASAQESMGEAGEAESAAAESEQTDSERAETDAATQASGEEGDEEGDEQKEQHTASGAQSTIGSPDQSESRGIPDDVPDGSDDDVVARQLREAAEKETDPELKKKLWEEYKRYKAGTG
ncbi:MAG: hypothetical protein WBM41_18620 [Arenicellales bacterium]